jgi:hypothetical protein
MLFRNQLCGSVARVAQVRKRGVLAYTLIRGNPALFRMITEITAWRRAVNARMGGTH